jgi:hypothetical protein
MYWKEDFGLEDMVDNDHEQQEQDSSTAPGSDTMQRITRVQERWTDWLMQKPNVIGVGVGLQKRRGVFLHQPCLVVLVSHKIPETQLQPEDRIPHEIEGILIDVQEAGMFAAQADE